MEQDTADRHGTAEDWPLLQGPALKRRLGEVVTEMTKPQGTPVREIIEIVPSPYIPAISAPGDTTPPGYWVDDIQKLLHPTDFQEFLDDMDEIETLNGRERVYALDYIRWLNKPRED